MDYVTSVELFIDLKPRICEVCLGRADHWVDEMHIYPLCHYKQVFKISETSPSFSISKCVYCAPCELKILPKK